jgi:large subunit ribosomal protein L6
MKKEIFQEIEIPEGVEANIDGNILTIKGNEGEVKREFKINKIIFEIKDGKIRLGNKVVTRNEKKVMNTMTAHIQNMIKGVQEKFEYKLKICASHFPMNVDIQGKEATVKNFLGEKIPRKTSILDNVDVQIDGDIITVTSINKESAGQTAANLEKATRVTGRDRRVFQDGIFITNKVGKEI